MAAQSLDQLKESAQEVFDKNPSANKVFATSDGNIFLPTAENAARNHGRQEKLEVHEIARPAAEGEEHEEEDEDKG